MSQKKAKGTVGIESFKTVLRLRLPRQVFGGKQKYLSLGLSDTPENRKAAELKARQIELDILSNNFDASLEKYKPQSHKPKASKVQKKTGLDLVELWGRYTNYRSKQVAETTLKIQYAAVGSHIAKLPSPELSGAIQTRDFLISTLSQDAAKRTLTQISACCDWAEESSLIDANPFRGMAKKIKVIKDDSRNIDPFSVEEKEAIIQAFEVHPIYSYYAPFVKFLFFTGCRTGEAVGLKWKHISHDCKTINFCESVSTRLKIRKDCKTHKSRLFPCNQQLQALLLSIKPENYSPEALVFPSKRGKVISAKTFIENAWKGRDDRKPGIVTQLVNEGKVDRYRTQYNTRHTFITHCLEAGVSVVQVAKWVGNSPEIIMKHYAGIIRPVEVPEF
jgi:integrase